MIRITDEQWALIEPHLLALPLRKDGRGRLLRSDSGCLDGILWVLETGGAVEGAAEGVSGLRDLLASPSAVGGARCLEGHLASRAGPPGREGMVSRRVLRDQDGCRPTQGNQHTRRAHPVPWRESRASAKYDRPSLSSSETPTQRSGPRIFER